MLYNLITDPVYIKAITLFIFGFTYLLIMFFDRIKHIIAGIGVLLFVLIGVLSPGESLASVNWNVIGMYIGMLLVSELFMESKMPEFIAGHLIDKTKKASIALIVLCALAGILSMFLMNVAAVLIIAPIALHVARKLEFSPILLMIGITVVVNVAGLATMMGDPTSFIFASYNGMKFNDFFFFNGQPGLFFASLLATAAAIMVLDYFFRRDHHRVPEIMHPKVHSYFGTVLFVTLIIGLIMTSSFSKESFERYAASASTDFGMRFFNDLAPFADYTVGIICMALGLVAFGWHIIYRKDELVPILKGLDWHTCIFLVEIFVLVAALMKTGFAKDIALIIQSLNGHSVFASFVIVTLISMLISSFVLNIPFVAAMMPVIGLLSKSMNISPYLLGFGLAIGVSFGGNMTPIGASANVVMGGIIRKHHRHVSLIEWAKIAIPATLVAVLVSSTFIWIFFS